jgi:hypothetical protein
MRCFGTLLEEMVKEEVMMDRRIVEFVGRQADRECRNARCHLRIHQARHDSLRDEFVSVDTAIYHQSCGDDGIEAPGFAELFRKKRQFERPGHIINCKINFPASCGHIGFEPYKRLINDISVPAGFDESYV